MIYDLVIFVLAGIGTSSMAVFSRWLKDSHPKSGKVVGAITIYGLIALIAVASRDRQMSISNKGDLSSYYGTVLFLSYLAGAGAAGLVFKKKYN